MTSTPSSSDSSTEACFASATSRKDRLRQFTPGELLLGALAPVVLPLIAFAVRRWGLRRVQRRLRSDRWRPTVRTAEDALEAARRLAWAVDVAARRGPWPANCLDRSVTLWWFLHRRGIPGELRIGVRRRPGSPAGSRTLDFHAWVEHGGVVLNDVPDVGERFATFGRPIAPPDARWR